MIREERAIQILEQRACCMECVVTNCTCAECDEAFDMAIKAIKQEPRKGHWIIGKYKDTCSECRCTYPKNIGFKNFCPNCGADMREVEK